MCNHQHHNVAGGCYGQCGTMERDWRIVDSNINSSSSSTNTTNNNNNNHINGGVRNDKINNNNNDNKYNKNQQKQQHTIKRMCVNSWTRTFWWNRSFLNLPLISIGFILWFLVHIFSTSIIVVVAIDLPAAASLLATKKNIVMQQQQQQLQPSQQLSTNTNCTNVQHLFELQGISIRELPNNGAFDNGGMLRFCGTTAAGSCCQQNNEQKLATLSRVQFEKNTKDSISKLSTVLATRATKFNDFFRQLLAQSKKEFHEMFKRTYGVIYEQNSYVFSDLFSELENYYTRGKVDLSEAMDSFFNTLYQKMFTVLNAQYKFDDKYLGCVGEHMKELKPFGDVPDKLSVQIKRSFVATRTYEQALGVAADVVKNLINIRPNSDCVAALTKMQQCGLCKGYSEKPCSNYCINVMKGCLQYYNELDVEWDNFVSSMEKVSERLLGPFNIVMVVEPINIKISEAIMNFQETGRDISDHVFHGCGKPQLGRRRRDTLDEKEINPFVLKQITEMNHRQKRRSGDADRELRFKPLEFSNIDDDKTSNNKGHRKNKKKQQVVSKNKDNMENKEPLIDKLVRDIRQKVKDSKKFWSNLPYQICNLKDYAASISGMERNCWNGNIVDKYPHAIAHDSNTNPEFSTSSPSSSIFKTNSLIAAQLFALKNAVGQLKNAYNGLDVEWNDVEEPEYGSGSGSGAGGVFDYDDDENDDEDYNNRFTGKTDSNSQNGKTNHNNKNNDDDFGINGIETGTSGGNNNETNISSTQYPTSSVYNENNSGGRHSENNNKNSGGSSGGVGGSVFTTSATTTTTSTTTTSKNNNAGSKTTSDGNSTKLTQMTIRRALITYLFPIYMAWFGGIFSDFL